MKKELKETIKEENIISRDKLLEHGVHFGHKKRFWNPEMKNFILGEKNETHIINLSKAYKTLKISYNFLNKLAENNNNTFLFVGTKKQSKNTVKENAERVGAFYINERWLGGTLTNFKTIQNSIKRLRYLEKLEKENFIGYTKKENINLKKELDKLKKNLDGIKYMRRMPTAIFVTSIVDEKIVIQEAKKMNILVFGIADTNSNPKEVQFPIFGNDDANKSVSLITTLMADAIASAKKEPVLAAFKESGDLKVLGLNPVTVNKYNNNKKPFKYNNQKSNSGYNNNFKKHYNKESKNKE